MELAADIFPPERLGLITASQCHVLMATKGLGQMADTYARQLAMQRVFHHYDEIGTWQTEHGQYAEHEALQHARMYWNAKLEKPKFIANGLFGGSPDAVADDFGCDFKCPTSMQKWQIGRAHV